METPQNFVIVGQEKSLEAILAQLITEEIRKLDIRDSSELISPTSGLLHRNIRTKEPSLMDEERALTLLLQDLMAISDPWTRIKNGVNIGDKGVYSAAGYGYFPHLAKIMGAVEQINFSKKIAQIGYGTALNAAESSSAKEADFIRANLSILLKRLTDVANIILAIRKRIARQELAKRIHLLPPILSPNLVPSPSLIQ